MSQTAKNAKVAKAIHCVFLPFLANLAFLAVQIVRRSKKSLGGPSPSWPIIRLENYVSMLILRLDGSRTHARI